MLAEKAEEPTDNTDWLNEQKLDGVRCIAYLDDSTRLQSRSGQTITHKFPELWQVHRQVSKPAILDAEIACASFQDIQKRIGKEKLFDIKMARTTYPVCLHAFTILYIDDKSFMDKPEIARKEILSSLMEDSEVARVLPYEIGNGVALYKKTKAAKQEGIMSKLLSGLYLPGKRVDWWRKLKHWAEPEAFTVCGLTEPDSEERPFGSLILGHFRNDEWVPVGNCGIGMDQRTLEILMAVFSSLKGLCPFRTPTADKVKFWCRPVVEVEVTYFEVEKDGKLRSAVFRRIIGGD